MQQYFINQKVKVGDTVLFNEEQIHHILHVVRMKTDDIVRISDASHSLFHVRLNLQKKHAVGIALEALEDHTKTKVEITLIQGLIKGEKWDYLIQKACELGVTRIVPFVSKRSVVKIMDDKIDKKLQRWNKIALEACEQCKRSTPVEVLAPISFRNIANYRSDMNLIAYEDADACSEKLFHVLRQEPEVQSISCVIGSEGGFEKEEVRQLIDEGFHRISLGYRILRAETAALSIINTIDFYYNMLGDQ